MKKIFTFLFALVIAFGAFAQDDSAGAAQANNPLANMTALNFQNYFTPKLTNASDASYMNTTWIRYATPFADGKLLLRVSAPLSTIGTPDPVTDVVNTTNGLGDINAFLSYNFVSKPTTTMGIGPLISMPTASKEVLGSGKWQGGLAFVAFIAKSPVFQYGALVTWQTSFAGDSDRNGTNNSAIQPFYFFQLGKGTYLRGAPIWYYDFENDSFNMPMGLGLGQVVKVGSTVMNLFMEPQYTMLSKGTQPQFQLFAGINLQFTK
ncbi:hypothetical protein [Algoriphagus sp.]|uniref:hypothetical protein n=1 Tax=Algoriphagus sp. TaxID=1872435 RepID=UPI00329821B1